MALHVKWQVIWSWKAPVTVWTFEWLCTSMFSVVSCKFIWASKAPCAAFPGTFVGFLSSVGSPVSLEMWAFSVNFGATFIIAFVDSPSFHMICFTLKWQRIGQFKNRLEHKGQRGKEAKMQKSNREAFVLTQLCESPSHCLCLVQSWMKGILKMLIMKMHLFIPYKYALMHLKKTLLGIFDQTALRGLQLLKGNYASTPNFRIFGNKVTPQHKELIKLCKLPCYTLLPMQHHSFFRN